LQQRITLVKEETKNDVELMVENDLEDESLTED
jgi:hypothetical protein